MMLILLSIRPVLDYDLDHEEPQIPPYHEVTNQNAMVPKKLTLQVATVVTRHSLGFWRIV